MTPLKKISDKPAGLRARAGKREAAAAVPKPMPADLGGKLPGDDANELYWEARVARWLGVALKRVRLLRRRALVEGEHWQIINQEIVYTLAGLQKLRDLLGSMGALPAEAKEQAKAEPAAPVGPPKRVSAVVRKIYQNSRLMLVRLPDEAEVLVLVRDNRNFMPAMKIEVTHDARANRWQYCGRMPRHKGRF